MRTSLRLGAVLCAGALLVGACTSPDASPDDTATTTTEASPSVEPSTEATSEDPFAVPDPITEAYVDRVVNAIYAEWGEIFREILQEPADPSAVVPPETRDDIASLFLGEYLLNRLSEADATARGDREYLLPADEFTHFTFSTRKVTEATEDCLVAVGDLDLSGTAVNGGTELVAVSLSPEPMAHTGWKIRDVLLNQGKDGEDLPEKLMLDATVSDFGGALEHTC